MPVEALGPAEGFYELLMEKADGESVRLVLCRTDDGKLEFQTFGCGAPPTGWYARFCGVQHHFIAASTLMVAAIAVTAVFMGNLEWPERGYVIGAVVIFAAELVYNEYKQRRVQPHVMPLPWF